MKRTRKIVTWICIFAVIIGITPAFSTRGAATAYANGDIIEFGSYPQARVTDQELIESLEAEAADVKWQAMGYTVSAETEYFFYKDVLLAGKKYRAIRFTRVNSSAQARYGYQKNTVYWFRFEPIHWTVLDSELGLLIANDILDVQPIYNATYNSQYGDVENRYYLNNYVHSNIRVWLNDSFSDSAFSQEETDMMILREQDNDLSGMDEAYTQFEFENTSDMVFLLSYNEAGNDEWFPDDTSRIRVGTSYARALGLENYHNQDPVYYPDNDYWFLRSPGHRSTIQGYVSLNGALYSDMDCYSFDVGVCPAVYIDLNAYKQMNIPDDPQTDPYENLFFSFDEGILTVSGTGTIPTADRIEDTPLAPYAEDCKVIIISEGIEGIAQNAFPRFSQLSTLILNGIETIAAGAFSTNETIDTVICSKTVRFSENAFHEASAIDVYELKNAPHNGSLSALCNVMPYSFSDGTLYIEGSTEMDIYALLDLMAVMCGYFDDLRFVRFNSYTSMDVPFYVYSEKESDYVLADNNTLHDVSFSVKISGQEGWQTITFNEFCALAGSHELGTFHLVAEVESGENVQESAFQIMMNNIQIGIKKVLKWIVGLLNYLFNILSKFKTS